MTSIANKFFIIGAQRTGTTMLQLILNSHSKICVAREAEFLMPFLKWKYVHSTLSGYFLKNFYSNYLLTVGDDVKFSYAHFSEFFSQLSDTNPLTLKELLDGLFTYCCQSKGKSIWGNKTPLFVFKINLLFNLFPDAKFLHIVRDGRDVFNSRRRLRHIDNDPIINAIDWTYKQFKIERSFEKIPSGNKLIVRYEDLLDKPKGTITSICSLLGIEFEDNMLNFYKTSRNHLSPRHSKLIFKALNKDNKYKWKVNLSPKEIKIFDTVARHYLKKYNYVVSESSFMLSFPFYLLKSLLFVMPNKIIPLIDRKKTFDRAIKKGKIAERRMK